MVIHQDVPAWWPAIKGKPHSHFWPWKPIAHPPVKHIGHCAYKTTVSKPPVFYKQSAYHAYKPIASHGAYMQSSTVMNPGPYPVPPPATPSKPVPPGVPRPPPKPGL